VSISRVLVVDDDPAIRRLVCDVLETHGYCAVPVIDGVSALMAVSHERPDCVVLDVMMPGLDGFEVLSRIRQDKHGIDLPVVMLTASASDAQAWRAWAGGVDYFLAKPFNPDELLNFLAYLGGDGMERAGAAGLPA
jgi:CheY-like chemotaxis protein